MMKYNSRGTMNIIVTDTPSAAEIEELRQNLVIYNSQYFDTSSLKALAVFITNSSGEKIAGISGSTLGRWLSIHYLWVSSNQRHSGLGSKLIKTAEKEALSRGCQYAQVDTYSFQARPFYERQGYQLQMTLEQCPVEHQKYYLTKMLDPTACSID